ncbi:nitric oxide synthase-interacting protein [Menidia menidia]
MTRHGKNCTAGAVYTYHEKRKDTAASGYGTQSIRLGKDAIKDFDCCCLSLQPCQSPVVTPDGYLYEKQAILEYILHQKMENAKKMKAYEKQKQAQKSSLQLESKSEERQRVERFKSSENSIVSKPINPFTSGQSKESEGSRAQSSSGEAPPAGPASASASTSTSTQSLPSFWIPSLTPEAKPTILKKPSKAVLCPMSGRAIRMNELIPVRFTPLDPSLDRVALLNRQERYVCAVTRDVLGNSVPCAVLRPSGSVVTQECVEKLIKKDMTDPVTGDTLSDKDIIPLQRGGTGFAASGVDLSAKEARPVMQV